MKSEMDAERPMKRPPITRKLGLEDATEGHESECMQQWIVSSWYGCYQKEPRATCGLLVLTCLDG